MNAYPLIFVATLFGLNFSPASAQSDQSRKAERKALGENLFKNNLIPTVQDYNDWRAPTDLVSYETAISSGPNQYCSHSAKGGHPGIDIQTQDMVTNSNYINHLFYALDNGVVTSVNADKFGTIATYNQSTDKTTLYLHGKDLRVTKGQEINIGEPLGIQSNSGIDNIGPFEREHVHVEVIEGVQTGPLCGADNPSSPSRVSIDPVKYLFSQLQKRSTTTDTVTNLTENDFSTEIPYLIAKYGLTEEQIIRIRIPQIPGKRKALSKKAIKAIKQDDSATILTLIRNDERFFLTEYWRKNSQYGPFELSLVEGSENVALLMLELGAPHDRVYGGRQTALIDCISNNLPEVCTKLLELGANPNNPNYYTSMIGLARERGNAEIVKLLEKFGAKEKEEVQASENVGAASSNERECPNIEYVGLSEEQGKALLYVFKQEEARLRGPYCIKSVRALETFPVRGNTYVKYQIDSVYPNGWSPVCLKRKRYGDMRDFAGSMSCPVKKAIPRGQIIRFDGETEI